MRKVFLAVLCFYTVLFSACVRAEQEREFVIVTASYNNKDWYERNLNSVFNQDSNFRLIYVDDCSRDGTGDFIESYMQQRGIEYQVIVHEGGRGSVADWVTTNCKVSLVRNKQRCGALANQYNAIHSCKDHEIVVILDGDDWFAHNHVLSYLNKVYADGSIWLTYGQFKEYPNNVRGFCCPMPAQVVVRNAFREFVHIPSHLRTFYAGLFQKIKKKDFMYEGEFLQMTGDIAAMFPMIEMARDHFKFIPEILCIYNGANVLNDHKVSKKMQRDLDLYIRSLPRYDKIDSPIQKVVVGGLG